MAGAPSPTIDYLVRTMQLNPVLQGDEIIRARAAAIGLKQDPVVSKAAAASDAGQARRDRMARLEDVRADFWTMPAEELFASLAALDNAEFPDIQLAVRRLSTIAQHREAFVNLLQDTDLSFRQRLERVLTGNRADAAVAKQELLGTFVKRPKRREARKVLKRLKQRVPVVYDLDSQWLAMLYQQKPEHWTVWLERFLNRDLAYGAKLWLKKYPSWLGPLIIVLVVGFGLATIIYVYLYLNDRFR